MTEKLVAYQQVDNDIVEAKIQLNRLWELMAKVWVVSDYAFEVIVEAAENEVTSVPELEEHEAKFVRAYIEYITQERENEKE